jgi:predicted DNA-binding protein (UPF0251 family)
MEMLLPIKNTNDCLKDLLRVTRLAGSLFNYAARWPDQVFNEKDFKSQPAFRPVVNRKAIKDALAEIIALTVAEREQLRDAFYHDIRFRRYANNETFEFSYPQLDEHIQLAGQKLLVAFYEGLGSGFTKLPKQKVDPLNRAVFERMYRKTNREELKIMLCPACLEWLSSPVPGESGKPKSLVDCDHFLPKSIYPPLAVHPFNLTFICTKCNSRLKAAKDPLGSDTATPKPHRPGALMESFIPYLRPGLEEIELEFFKDRRELRVIGRHNIDHADKRAANFDRVFELSQRWSDYLDSCDCTFRAKIGLEGKAITKQLIKKVLTRIALEESKSIFHEVGAFVRSQYATWLVKNRLDVLYREYTNAPEP